MPNSANVALWAPIYKNVPICQEERWNSWGFYKDSIVLRKTWLVHSEKYPSWHLEEISKSAQEPTHPTRSKKGKANPTTQWFFQKTKSYATFGLALHYQISKNYSTLQPLLWSFLYTLHLCLYKVSKKEFVFAYITCSVRFYDRSIQIYTCIYICIYLIAYLF